MSALKYRNSLGQFLGVDASRITLYAKGRVGLYTILKALDINEGDEVIIPAFTCVVVSNAIIYVGAIPIYVDIDPLTYNMDASKVSKAITNKTKLIIAQNTFGLSPDYDALNDIAKSKSINIIEDCTHGFGGTFKGQKNGTLSMASFFSTQWNKPFSTGIGGFVVTNNKELSQKMEILSKQLKSPSKKDELVLTGLIWARENLLKPTFYWTLVKSYRFLSKYKLVIGSSSDDELTGVTMPNDYFKGLGAIQAETGIKNLKRLSDENKHREQLAQMYDNVLNEQGFGKVFVPEYATHTFMKYPFFVKNKKTFLERAEKAKIPLGEWFVSPIHPIEKDFHLWHYNYGSFPIAEKISQHILNLPTDFSISIHKAEYICQFLRENKSYLLSTHSFL